MKYFSLLVAVFVFGLLVAGNTAQAQFGSSCSEYGMAYSSGSYCKCMAGYVMGENLFGDPYCISEDQACKDQYGYNARANYAGGCECGYGYVFDSNMFGDKECVSADSVCKKDLGVMSRYNSLSDSCECTYGYVIDNGRCVDGDQVCHSDHGYHSSYNSLSNRCECDDDYTLDDYGQCVEKQHNVYFKLLDISPEDDKELLIKSEYDFSRYIIRVGVGCLGTTLGRYEGKNIVVNLGTDYDVDTFDTVVLQDHDQTCSILYKEKTYEDSFPEPEEDDYFYYIPPATTYSPTEVTPEPVQESTIIQNPTHEDVNYDSTGLFEDMSNDNETLKLNREEESEVVAQIDLEEEAASSSEEVVINGDEGAIEPDNMPESAPASELEKPSFFKRVINFLFGWL